MQSSKSFPRKLNVLDFDFFNFEDWPLCFIRFHYLDARHDDWIPIPHSSKDTFRPPDFQKDQPDYINSRYPRLLVANLFTCQ